MSDKNLKEELNPSLVVIKDNKPRWYLPETRRDGYRNLHKINRYGLLYRSDLVLKLEKNYNQEIEKIPSVQKMLNHKYFCSLLIGKGQDLLFEKYADDFTEETPQTIMSITKMFVNLFVGELVEKRYFQELSYEEIATEMNLPLGTVKAQLFRARDFLASMAEKTKDSI